MHDKYGLLQDRLKRDLLEKIIPAIQTCITPLGLAAWHVEGGQGEPVAPSVALARDEYEPLGAGDKAHGNPTIQPSQRSFQILTLRLHKGSK